MTSETSKDPFEADRPEPVLDPLRGLLKQAIYKTLKEQHPGHDWQYSEDLASDRSMKHEDLKRFESKEVPGELGTPAALRSLPVREERKLRYVPLDAPQVEPPKIGDVLLAQVESIGTINKLENRGGRPHELTVGSWLLCVYGNRYAVKEYEGLVPGDHPEELALLHTSGIVGIVERKHHLMGEPTKVTPLGRVITESGATLSTFTDPPVPLPDCPPSQSKTDRPKMIVVTGASRNVEDGRTAAAICAQLTRDGATVVASRLTGTASAKELLRLEDAGAKEFFDFTSAGYPSTYQIRHDELLRLFWALDEKCCKENDAGQTPDYWVVELADSPVQREVRELFNQQEFVDRIHLLVLGAQDVLGALGGVRYLEDEHGLSPHICAGALGRSEIERDEIEVLLENRVGLLDPGRWDPDDDGHLKKYLAMSDKELKNRLMPVQIKSEATGNSKVSTGSEKSCHTTAPRHT